MLAPIPAGCDSPTSSEDDGEVRTHTFELTMHESGGVCGTWDVKPDEKAEMPCDYDAFLDSLDSFIVTEENGSGEEAYAQ